jgi:hypothetical protein
MNLPRIPVSPWQNIQLKVVEVLCFGLQRKAETHTFSHKVVFGKMHVPAAFVRRLFSRRLCSAAAKQPTLVLLPFEPMLALEANLASSSHSKPFRKKFSL